MRPDRLASPARILPSLAFVSLASLLLAPARRSSTSERLRTEYATNPIGIDEPAPRLSWMLHAERRGTSERVRDSRRHGASELARRPLWSSGRVTSDESVNRAYGGPALEPRPALPLAGPRVGRRGARVSDWSAPAYWETGLMGAAHWKAKWITPDLAEDTTRSNPARCSAPTFTLDGTDRVGARVRHEPRAVRDGDQWPARRRPGARAWLDELRQAAPVPDVRRHRRSLQRGPNAVGVTLGDGWYRGRLGVGDAAQHLRQQLGAARADRRPLHRRSRAGHRNEREWKASTGPILTSDIYNGETYDARLERAGWSQAGFDDARLEGRARRRSPADEI